MSKDKLPATETGVMCYDQQHTTEKRDGKECRSLVKVKKEDNLDSAYKARYIAARVDSLCYRIGISPSHFWDMFFSLDEKNDQRVEKINQRQARTKNRNGLAHRYYSTKPNGFVWSILGILYAIISLSFFIFLFFKLC